MRTNMRSVIINIDKHLLAELRNIIPQDIINIIKTPQKGLLMMTAKDSFDTDFYLGEVLVTEAEVECKGLKGYAMVMGDEPEMALLAASVDAILQADDGELKQKVMDFITAQAKKTAEADEMEKRLIAKTKVNFETMVKG